MVVEGSSATADIPSKTTLPRKSAFSCEACRKRKLEARVAQLEDALSKVRHADADTKKVSSPGSVAESSSSAGRRVKSEHGEAQELARDFDGLNVETDGRISFHGPTSLFQLPSGVVNETASNLHVTQELEARKERLINSAWRERAFEQMATMPISPLLDQFDGGRLFYQRAQAELFESLKGGYARIPTIQTLLLMSAQECGRGNRTQAWLYSGMAFRLLDDLGISIDSRKYSGSAQLSDEDIEIRNRLFWSCYFWDKIVSLYFGRSPTMQHSRVSPPRMILDDTSEVEIWTPHGVRFPDGAHYPPTEAHSTSCFMKMCGLAEILNQILVHIYPMSQTTESEFLDCVQEQAKNLSDWWDELPDYLRLVPTDLPPIFPPKSYYDSEPSCPMYGISDRNPVPVRLIPTDIRRQPRRPSPSPTASTPQPPFSSLEIQALKYAAPGTLDKLRFCIFALERIKVTNPVMATALQLVYQEVQKLQIDINVPGPAGSADAHKPTPRSHPQNSQSPSVGSNPSRHVSPGNQHQPVGHPQMTQQQTTVSTAAPMMPGYNAYQPQQVGSYPVSPMNEMPQMPATHLLGGMPNAVMNFDDPRSYEITPEVFEAFSYAQPISANMASPYANWAPVHQ
ncbi:hypothetical protein N7470_003957 [Penicillium chermesinum]|nr:hypothetical protein N7470_003957 [Penicillium chermesinum]